MARMLNILLIGGTGEAVQLNRLLAPLDNIQLFTSLAGRTHNPPKLEGNVIAGGFSEIGGLDAFLEDNQINLVVDASHPYAAVISHKANRICVGLEIPYLRFDRYPWDKKPGDLWIDAVDMDDAVLKLEAFEKIFLTIGRQELAAFKDVEDKSFVVRSIEDIVFDPLKSNVTHIRDKGPFSKENEISLMKAHGIEVVVSKNSGGDATYAKIAAARELSIPVIMIKRPSYDPAEVIYGQDDLLAKIRLLS